MGPTSETAVKDNTWYIAIQEGFGKLYYSFVGVGSESYSNFSEITARHGIKIVAERFEVNDETINKLSGFSEQGKRIEGDSLLIQLVKRLEAGEKLDVQAELDKLC